MRRCRAIASPMPAFIDIFSPQKRGRGQAIARFPAHFDHTAACGIRHDIARPSSFFLARHDDDFFSHAFLPFRFVIEYSIRLAAIFCLRQPILAWRDSRFDAVRASSLIEILPAALRCAMSPVRRWCLGAQRCL